MASQEILLLLVDGIRIAETIGAVASIGAAAIGGGYAVWRAVQRVRKARADEELAIQKRIKDAIATTKTENAHAIEMAEQLTAHWKSLAEVYCAERDHEREVFTVDKKKAEAEIVRVREERDSVTKQLAEAKAKVEEVVDLNLGLQGQISENRTKLKDQEQSLTSLQTEFKTLQKKVTKIDGVQS